MKLKKLLMLAVFVFAFGILLPKPPAQAETACEKTLTVTYGQSEAREMIDMINDLRLPGNAWYWNEDDTTKTEPDNLQPLTYDYGLEAIAMQRAAELAVSYSHTRPNGTRCFTAYDITYYTAGENIAYGYPTLSGARVFELWCETDDPYDGQGHRRNMLDEDFTAVGIGHVIYNGVHYWAQEFAAPSTGAAYTAPLDAAKTVSIPMSTTGHLDEDQNNVCDLCGKQLKTLPAPTGLTASATGDGVITLKWNPVDGATQYNVYRYRGDLKQYVYLGTAYSAVYKATGLANGTAYYFKVLAAAKGSGATVVSPLSAAAHATALGKPAAPVGVNAKASGEGAITLSWNKTPGATQYNVYRYRGDQKKYVYIGTSYTQSYKVSGLTKGTTYYFKVLAATKGNGLTFVGPLSDAAQTKALGTPAAPTGVKAANAGAGKVALSWNKTAGATQYNIYRYRGDLKKYVYVGTSYSLKYTAAGLSSGTTYYFKVMAVSKGDGLTYTGPYSAAVNAPA